LQIYTVMGIAALIWLPLSVIGFVTGGPTAVLGLSDALAVVVILVSAFERWGWRWRKLHPHLIGTPDIRGTWRGTLKSSWKDPATQTDRPPKIVYLAIRQTLATVWVRLLTDESVSNQMAGSMQKDRATEDWNLSYTYSNVPDIFLRKQSPEHRGGTFLTVTGEPPRRIHGEFWTSRDTKGTLDMVAHVDAIAHTFDDAEGIFDGQATPRRP
jgi:hypothetical protein